VPSLAFAQSNFGTLSFSPADPSPSDSILVTLVPAPGEPDWCAFHTGFPASNVVFIDAVQTACPDGEGTTNVAAIGKLRAGVYTVVWGFHDNFNNVPVPSAQLTVRSTDAAVPIFSVMGMLLLSAAVLSCGIAMAGRTPNATR
jgi:hypothetical protein